MRWAGTRLIIPGIKANSVFQMPPQGSRTGSEAGTSPQPPWFTPVFSGSGGGGGSASVLAVPPRNDAGALHQPPTVRGLSYTHGTASVAEASRWQLSMIPMNSSHAVFSLKSIPGVLKD